MATIMPHGVLFRSGDERVARKYFIANGYLEAVIGLPGNLFYGTGIPACILVMNKQGAKNPKGELRSQVLFINADREFREGKAQNHLRPEDAGKIIRAYREKKEIPAYARIVPIAELEVGSLVARSVTIASRKTAPIIPRNLRAVSRRPVFSTFCKRCSTSSAVISDIARSARGFAKSCNNQRFLARVASEAPLAIMRSICSSASFPKVLLAAISAFNLPAFFALQDRDLLQSQVWLDRVCCGLPPSQWSGSGQLTGIFLFKTADTSSATVWSHRAAQADKARHHPRAYRLCLRFWRFWLPKVKFSFRALPLMSEIIPPDIPPKWGYSNASMKSYENIHIKYHLEIKGNIQLCSSMLGINGALKRTRTSTMLLAWT